MLKNLNARRTAKEAGEKYYFTSLPCIHGHIDKRFTSCGRCVQCCTEWKLNNPDKIKAATFKFNRKHSDTLAMNRRNGKKRVRRARPSWWDQEERAKIKEMYALSKFLTAQLNEEFHVDHIIPLQGEIVCGLHVYNNLQILPALENISKNNRFKGD